MLVNDATAGTLRALGICFILHGGFKSRVLTVKFISTLRLRWLSFKPLDHWWKSFKALLHDKDYILPNPIKCSNIFVKKVHVGHFGAKRSGFHAISQPHFPKGPETSYRNGSFPSEKIEFRI